MTRIMSTALLRVCISIHGHGTTPAWCGVCPYGTPRGLATARHIFRGNYRHAHDRKTQCNCYEASRHAVPLDACEYLGLRVITFSIMSRRFSRIEVSRECRTAQPCCPKTSIARKAVGSRELDTLDFVSTNRNGGVFPRIMERRGA